MVHPATKLLDDFRALPGHVERPRTFMEIAGYPHYENVCSNILAFFMDPEESYGLGTLVLDALASAGNIAATDQGVGGNVSVEREVPTDEGNRIDILIQSDDHVVLIENKIFAPVGNPFPDYTAYLDRIASNRRKHKFLLTLSQTNEGGKWEFENLAYEEFVKQIRSLLGRYVSDADTRYLTMFLDFLNTLEYLQEGTRMDQEFVKFLAERDNDIEDLLAEVKRFKTELREKVRDLGTLIDIGKHQNVEKQNVVQGSKTPLSYVLFHDIRAPRKMTIAIDAVISPQGWRIEIFPRRKGNKNLSDLRDFLENLNIECYENGHFVYCARFAYDENLDQIRPVLQDLIDKIATYQEVR